MKVKASPILMAALGPQMNLSAPGRLRVGAADYRLGPEDVVEVSAFQAAGLTPREFEPILADELRNKDSTRSLRDCLCVRDAQSWRLGDRKGPRARRVSNPREQDTRRGAIARYCLPKTRHGGENVPCAREC
jgi:protein involved in polysaccharide export with SLBB domain